MSAKILVLKEALLQFTPVNDINQWMSKLLDGSYRLNFRVLQLLVGHSRYIVQWWATENVKLQVFRRSLFCARLSYVVFPTKFGLISRCYVAWLKKSDAVTGIDTYRDVAYWVRKILRVSHNDQNWLRNWICPKQRRRGKLDTLFLWIVHTVTNSKTEHYGTRAFDDALKNIALHALTWAMHSYQLSGMYWRVGTHKYPREH